MASSENWNFNTACLRRGSTAQMLIGKNLDAVSAAAPQNFQPRDEVVRTLERRGFLNIDLNVAPPEAADYEFTAEEGGGNGAETLAADAAPDDSSIKAVIRDERELNFNFDAESELEEAAGINSRWIALLGVAENALREKKEEEIGKRKRVPSQEAMTRKRVDGQRRQSLVEEWKGDVAAAVVRSTRGRTVAMPSKYRDSVLGAVAVAEFTRHNKNVKTATGFCTKRKSR